MDRVRKIIHAQAAYDKGCYGQGITTVVLDTGVYPHADLQGQILEFYDFVNRRKKPYDDCSHGTHVCGILCGSGKMSEGRFMGIAPRSRIISLKVLDKRGNGNIADVIQAIAWCITKKDEYKIRIMNISVGALAEQGDEKEKMLVQWVEKAWDAGIVVVVAAGNMGPKERSVTVPGNSKKVITVGACDDAETNLRQNKIAAHYSGRGPTMDCICKPDISAPGTNVISCTIPGKERFYARKSGTSMATPVVSGCIALLLSRCPDMENVEVKMRLRESVVDAGCPKQQQGWGRIDIAKMMDGI
ncbi:MAG: S8 family peptidase [Robinsoniella sp.]|nr:S8 family peptidase [Robinsoniella sp.]